jgi:hypothetical protein
MPTGQGTGGPGGLAQTSNWYGPGISGWAAAGRAATSPTATAIEVVTMLRRRLLRSPWVGFMGVSSE